MSDRRELGSVANALRMLEALAVATDAGVSELARDLAISKASVDRLLTTFASAGFVERDPVSRRYRLSLKIAMLAESVRSRTGIVELARPHLRALSEQVREGVNLGVLVDGALVYAEVIPSAHVFRIEARPGMALPAYCTAAGKALLALLPADQLDAYLAELEPLQHTPTTLTSAARIRAALDEVRRAGYAIDHGEMLEEAYCVAAPVLDRDRRGLAAVSVTVLRSQFEAKRDELITAVTATARDIAEDPALAVSPRARGKP